ncbi:hypothetical protein NIES4074_18400 [Cylindrospermum sp. NIES-4074]|nr:hypothetical protein NIES4074_18400 [Cylindrospermum sp. NIES-4074]
MLYPYELYVFYTSKNFYIQAPRIPRNVNLWSERLHKSL